ncbi:MAG: hypothetical protein ACMUIA_11015 [bacterium]
MHRHNDYLPEKYLADLLRIYLLYYEDITRQEPQSQPYGCFHLAALLWRYYP